MTSVAHMVPKITFRVLHGRGPVPDWGGGLGSARPDALQLDRGGGNSLLLDLLTTRTTLSHPGLGSGEDADWEQEHGKVLNLD